ATMRVKEWQGDVVFLHEVIAGAADRSYGIQVAKLAGLPASVIARAKVVLAQLEANDRKSPARGLDDLPLFQAVAPAAPVEDPAVTETLAALDTIQPDEMTPREALDALYRLKNKRGGKAN
ncbi:MAG: DNA mismatch repair protein MutS, partial [Pseudorhodoplanes sp.]